jgi:hypothetical protein
MSETPICPIGGLRKVLLATDGSLHSEAALREAMKIAKACTTKLYILSVIEANPEYESLAPLLVEKAEKEAKKLLDSMKECAEKEGIECETIVHEGDEPYEFIVDEAGRKKVDMIIMGRHGRKGLKRLLMGSVTSKVVGHAPCSVLVVTG